MKDFDEQWYLARYPDVAKAVRDGRVKSGLDHYLEHGKKAGRQPKDPGLEINHSISTKPNAPRSPRELLELIGDYDANKGINFIVDQLDWNKITPHQIFYTVLARLPSNGVELRSFENFNSKELFLSFLESVEFQQSILKYVINAFPEKRRLLFVHIPKCAGSDLAGHLSQSNPFLTENLRNREWANFTKLLSILKDLVSKIANSSTIFVGGHVRLKYYIDNGLYRYGDRIFSIVRNPIEIAISESNYISTRFLMDPEITRADTRNWARHLGLTRFDPTMSEDELRDFTISVLNNSKLVKGRNLCTFLGAGEYESAVDMMARCNIEITDVQHYQQWLRDSWNIESTTQLNKSKPILTLNDISQAQRNYLSELCSEDMKLYELIIHRLKRNGGCRIFASDLL